MSKHSVHSDLKEKSPPQMAKGDPQMATRYPSVDKGATRKETAPTPKTLGPRDA